MHTIIFTLMQNVEKLVLEIKKIINANEHLTYIDGGIIL